MMIVSQEKHLLNYDNVIEICKTFGNEKDVSIIATTINDDIVLGEYDTEERADEVLEEIVEQYEHEEDCKCDRSYLATLDNFTYRMPKS